MFALAALGAAWLPDTALLEANQLHTLYYADANFKIFPQAVLEAVGKVVWNFSDVPSNIDLTSGGVGKHYHYDEPYSTNTTLMHEVVDGVAAQIEIVAAACA